MRITWVETNHLFKGNMEHSWIIRECKGWWTMSTRMGWNICKILLHALKMIFKKFQKTSTFGMIRHGLKVFGNYSWKYKFITICNKKSWFAFRFWSTKFLFVVAYNLSSSRCSMVGKYQNLHNHFSIPSSLKQSTQPLHHKKRSRWWNLNPCCWSHSCL
jgi:hypothetical protein